MQALVLAPFVAWILGLLAPPVQAALRGAIHRNRKALLLAPIVLSLAFCGVAASLGAWSAPLTALILVYTSVPVLIMFGQRVQGPPSLRDLAAMLWLWLPLEFSVGRDLIPASSRGYLHTVAYAITVSLALLLFLLVRDFPGVKYNPPRGSRDILLPLAGFALAAPVLIAVGLGLGFIQPFHIPADLAPGRLGSRYLLIFLATALPEEILFRGLIQNWIMQRFGAGMGSLLAASIVFGAAHLNNGPGVSPNWRYMIVATLAGVAYGAVFQKSSTVLSSALLHALVNTVRRFFF